MISLTCLDIAFDLLYVNDRSVMSLTGEQRMLMLKRCIKPKVKHTHTHTAIQSPRFFPLSTSTTRHSLRPVHDDDDDGTQEKVVEIVAQKPASTTEEIVNALDAAILNRYNLQLT